MKVKLNAWTHDNDQCPVYTQYIHTWDWICFSTVSSWLSRSMLPSATWEIDIRKSNTVTVEPRTPEKLPSTDSSFHSLHYPAPEDRFPVNSTWLTVQNSLDNPEARLPPVDSKTGLYFSIVAHYAQHHAATERSYRKHIPEVHRK